jgi:hypothetical protein
MISVSVKSCTQYLHHYVVGQGIPLMMGLAINNNWSSSPLSPLLEFGHTRGRIFSWSGLSTVEIPIDVELDNWKSSVSDSVSDAIVSVCMSCWMCVCVSFLLLCFKLNSGCLFSPHHVNQGGVQKATPHVTFTLFTNPTLLKRGRRSGRHSQVLPGHAAQARELLNLIYVYSYY